MSGNTDINPEAAADGARRLTTAADAAQTSWTAAAARIAALHAERPWGNDTAGQAFDTAYFQDGDGTGAATMIGEGDGGGGTHVKRLAELGPGVLSMVNETVSADELVASWFKTGA